MNRRNTPNKKQQRWSEDMDIQNETEPDDESIEEESSEDALLLSVDALLALLKEWYSEWQKRNSH